MRQGSGIATTCACDKQRYAKMDVRWWENTHKTQNNKSNSVVPPRAASQHCLFVAEEVRPGCSFTHLLSSCVYCKVNILRRYTHRMTAFQNHTDKAG